VNAGEFGYASGGLGTKPTAEAVLRRLRRRAGGITAGHQAEAVVLDSLRRNIAGVNARLLREARQLLLEPGRIMMLLNFYAPSSRRSDSRSSWRSA